MTREDLDRLSILLSDASKALNEAYEIMRGYTDERCDQSARELAAALGWMGHVDDRHELHSVRA